MSGYVITGYTASGLYRPEEKKEPPSPVEFCEGICTDAQLQKLVKDVQRVQRTVDEINIPTLESING